VCFLGNQLLRKILQRNYILEEHAFFVPKTTFLENLFECSCLRVRFFKCVDWNRNAPPKNCITASISWNWPELVDPGPPHHSTTQLEGDRLVSDKQNFGGPCLGGPNNETTSLTQPKRVTIRDLTVQSPLRGWVRGLLKKYTLGLNYASVAPLSCLSTVSVVVLRRGEATHSH